MQADRLCAPPLLPPPPLPQPLEAPFCHFAHPAEFDLEGLRTQLDEQGLAVATAQEASVRSRKALADRTKGGRSRLLGRGVGCGAVGGWGPAPEPKAPSAGSSW